MPKSDRPSPSWWQAIGAHEREAVTYARLTADAQGMGWLPEAPNEVNLLRLVAHLAILLDEKEEVRHG